MAKAPRFLVIGGGLAGVTAARKLRALVPAAAVTLAEAEPTPYYLRPGLISVVAGTAELADITPFDTSWYERQDIDLRTGGAVVALDLARRRVTLSSGEELPYDRLLLATGAQAAVPPLPGTHLEGVFTLRTAADAHRIRTRAPRARAAAVVGGGWLGLEVARALRAWNLPVTVLELAPWLLPRQLDREGSQALMSVVTEMGIHVRTGVQCQELMGDQEVRGVRLTDGEQVAAELVVMAAGVRPRTVLAAEAGLHTARGIVVDDFLQTSAPDVYACGDAAEWQGRVYGIIPAAREQGELAAQNMAEPQSTPYQGTVVANRLKVVGVDLACLGETQPQGGPGAEVRTAELERGVYRKFVVRDGRLVGAILLGDPEGIAPTESLIKAGAPVEDRLARLAAGDYHHLR
ncbi:MAG: NAD(P)/FAD-dependent oxidoreductase [Candidatus Bipolaricaulaceae bacterium]